MSTSRRHFLQTSATAGAGLALGLGSAPLHAAAADWADRHTRPVRPRSGHQQVAPLRILILGGTGFLGPHQVHEALERGHRVTIFTRGRTQPTVHVRDFDRVEHLIGDRADDLTALEGREWDVVLDNSTSRWEWARDSAGLLKDAAGVYLFVSSTGVYYPYLTTDIDESVEPLSQDPSGGEDGSAAYGVMKTLGERAVQEAFGERAIVARPQHFTGPGERSNRHNYWVERLDRGGEVLAMGRRSDPVMLLDVRDLVSFQLDLCESGTGGIFNVAGPASPLTQEEFLHGLRLCTGASVTWTWVEDYAFLKEHGLYETVPWVMLEGPNLGYTSINIDRALAQGLTHRPLAQTHLDFRDWWYSDAVPSERREDPRLTRMFEREAEILAAWKSR